MKNLLLVCVVLTSFQLFAQEKEQKNEKKERIEAARVSFITKKLELTPEESKAFWPLINEMEVEIKASRKAMKERIKELKKDDAKIDEETYKKILDDMHDQQVSIIEIKNDYSKKIGTIIGYEKAFKFEVEVQKEFKQQLMNRMKNAPSKRGGPGGPSNPSNMNKN